MKRSISVPLIFLGTLGGLTYCQNSTDVPANTEVQVKQDFYASLEDCQRDWGSEAQNCQQALTTTTVNGQDTVTSGYAGSNVTTGNATSGTTSTATSAGYHGSGGGYRYAGPRYYWYRNESGGYPMAVDPDGKTRAIIGSRIPESGAQFANQTINTKTTMPTHMTASKGVIRSGFGSFGRGASAGG
jgi:hypothetical protein